MKNIIFLAILLCGFRISSSAQPIPDDHLSVLRPRESQQNQEEAARQLFVRTLGQQKAKYFRVKVLQEMLQNGIDACKLLKNKDAETVTIEGSSGVAVAWCLNHYLKYFCKSQVSWQSKQVDIPLPLPQVNLTLVSNDRFRFYQNVCTWSYSMVWWKWPDWERHLDWMALNGINLALAPVGQEEVWRRVYLELGLTNEEMGEHFTGPGFLSWMRMGNVRGWGGPLTKDWHEASLTLQAKILARMRSLGIVPVLPAFSGVVPRAFERLFPKANLTKLTRWNGFTDEYCCPYLLSPTEPLFMTVGSMYLKKYGEMFDGLDHVYSSDTFNEMTPVSGNVTYLQKIGESIFAAMTAVDQNAIWMMQGWLFENQPVFWTKDRAKALLTSVPKGRMLVLDLQADRIPQYSKLESFYGQPFIWCMLHNFGGTLGLHGAARAINTAVFEARRAENSSMVGIGITPEGIDQNYVIYDLMLELSWTVEPYDLDLWFNSYSERRYGEYNNHTANAWKYLKDSVYDYRGNVPQHGLYIVVRRPRLHLLPDTWYNSSDVYSAWDELLAGAAALGRKRGPSLNYDLVDVTRQSLQLLADETYLDIATAYALNDTSTMERGCNRFLDLMSDLDRLLGTNKWFLLGRWITLAKAHARYPLETALYERNARNQVTIWGPNGEITDYANKQWSGLMADYYRARWQMFLKALIQSAKRKVHFDEGAVAKEIFTNIERPFTYSTKAYRDRAAGDPLAVSQQLHDRWRQKKAPLKLASESNNDEQINVEQTETPL